MTKRAVRHDVIRDIIRKGNIKTQRDLVEQLSAEGYDCTQATVSRDIAGMGLAKSREGYYCLLYTSRAIDANMLKLDSHSTTFGLRARAQMRHDYRNVFLTRRLARSELRIAHSSCFPHKVLISLPPTDVYKRQPCSGKIHPFPRSLGDF